ncbi:protein Skeletor, isoforms B/C [Venturia canescens]|uniref:protein Skeletor, isoforms B/C n=1 Tax=Venturia canescens TaxID=32260 RepID=UPI001C9D2B10|nr:protein Skeletor, isoforms B/C [Venturia canescens]XP_043267997.1 protein Skeletor, isoforms B/C [Venturia canescens]XP_043267998.1 protein Skeletor, isoforms B/C [Venturia canescens]
MEAIDSQRIALTLVLCNLVLPHFGDARNGPENYGPLIGTLTNYAHGISGRAYAVDDTTIFIKGFSYDGTGPDAYFWVGESEMPSPAGDIVPYPEDYVGRDPPVLTAYNNTDIILRLPQGKRIRDIKWLSVWCRRFTVNFGEVFIPENLEVPKTRVLPEFSRLAHGLSSGNISILDSKTIYIPNLHYDGAGPDAYFWVGNGPEPNALGTKVPNEMGGLKKLRGYQGEDIEIVLPGNLTVYAIDWLSVWCVQHKHNFGHVMIPKDLNVPPALGQTKITPPWWYNPTIRPPVAPPPRLELTNCKEMMDGRVQVQWEAIGDDVQIRLSGRVKDDYWVGFGLSGREGEPKMLESDVVVVAHVTKTNKFIADDYYISDLAQCDGKKGVCPDERVGGRNDVILLHGHRKNGVTTVEYRRPMRTNEPVLDRMIPDTETSVIAAIGPLNSLGEANSHSAFDKTTEDIRIDFTSTNVHECTNSLYDIPDRNEIDAWTQAVIEDETNFNVRIGPAGGDRGYSRFTGQPSWGIAWYVNDLLIPELTVERGQTYTFVVEGGNDPANPARYHPFYITNSPEGGYSQKTEKQQAEQKVYAGVEFDSDNYPYPTAAGRYCEWVHKTVDMSSQSATFEEYFQTLRLDCAQGEPAKLVWTVAEDTPDLVYYQCYTHNNLGWKIHVVDAGYRSRRNAGAVLESGFLSSVMAIISILSLRLKFLR